MGTQTMGGGSGKSDDLARQGSLYNLTLDEVQHQLGDLGKPLSSMNLDELLKSVWTAEANQGGVDFDHHGQLASTSSLHRQSSVTLNRDLSKKTVDEVWRDIQQGQTKKSSNNIDRTVSRERQATLGEMTLEDFLVKAGIVAEGNKNADLGTAADSIAFPQQSIPHQAQWVSYQQIPPIHQPAQQQNMLAVFMPGQQSLPIGGNPIMDAAVPYPDTQMTMSSSPLMGTLSDTQTPGRKRVAMGGVIEKTVERRQKRMIKNRESAARSRARKQAYTNELENKVSRLEEENERLKRQREVEKVLPSVPPPEPKYQLRRTSSSSF